MELLGKFLQNKNILMFITAMIFMCGILSYFTSSFLVCGLIITILAIVIILKNLIPIKYVLLWVFIFYFGFLNSYFRVQNSDDLIKFAPSKSVIKGQIVSIPDKSNVLKTKFFVRVLDINGSILNAKTLVTYSGNEFDKLQIGDFVELSGTLKIPFKATNPSQFDYSNYLRNFNTFTVFYSENLKLLDKELNFKWKFLQELNKVRDKIISVHAKCLKSPNLEILGGIVFGDDAVSPPEYIKTSFINSGLLHILAASGMNVAFIYGFWFFFMKRLKAPYKFTIISGMLLVVVYTLMTGVGASVIRAALMLLFILAGKLIDRDAHSVSLLAFVAMLMLIYNPAFINDVGFQLSFVVTFGLLTMADILSKNLEKTKFPLWLGSSIFIPVVAQVWVAPIQMFYFNTFSTYSVFANILSIPFLSVVSFGGFLSSIFALFSPYSDNLCKILDFILNWFLNIIVQISNFFGDLPFALITTTHPNILQIILYYLLILLLIYNAKRSKKFIIAIIIILFVSSAIYIPDSKFKVIAFDVQNADCFLLKSPDDKYFIIDTGRAAFRGGKAQANSVIIKYLKDKGIKNIEGLIITHFDNDHSGGAVDIINSVNVKNVYVNSFDDKSYTSENIYKIIKQKDINVKIPENGELVYKDADFTFRTYIADLDEDNENSIISLLSYKDFEILFMGDAGVKAFEALNIPSNIEVLKVGHHGGADVVSPQMLENLEPQVSIISTGPNYFGHPNKGTLDILRNTDIYRTDLHNSIEIVSNGIDYDINTYEPEKHKYVTVKNLKCR